MADWEQLERLKRSVKEWNEWRNENRGVEINLSSADLSNADLSKAILSHTDLSNANLSGSNLNEAILISADLSGVNLNDATLVNATLIEARLINATLNYANLNSVRLEKAKLSGVNLIHANLSEAQLFAANLRDAKLNGVNFNSAQLLNTELYDADLRNAKFGGAELMGTRLIRADLRDANLREVNLRGAYLTNSDLTGSDLREAYLIQTQALDTNFEGVTLTGACIKNWNINSKTNLNGVICDYIYLDEKYENHKNIYTDRRPYDPDRIFEPGEFTRLYQIVQDSLSLYFPSGVDWQAAAYSFQSITTDGTPLNIKGIEQTGDGVIIKVDVPDRLDEVKVEREFWKGYKMAQKAFEGERRATERHLESQERQINQLMTKLDEFRTVNITGNTIQGSGYTEELKGSGYTKGDTTTNTGD